jgi:hypothetical protein
MRPIIDWLRSKLSDSISWLDKHDGAITALATAIIAVLTWRLWVTSDDQWGTMQRQLDLSERPWVGADVTIAKPLFVGEHNMGYVGLWVTMTNEGHSVASHVVESAAPLLFGLNYYDRARTLQQKLCDRLEKSIGPTSSGYSLFPARDAKRYDWVLIDDVAAMAKSALGTPSSSPDSLSFSVVGCVDYQSIFSNAHHHTRFLYSLTVPSDIPVNREHAMIMRWGAHPELKLFPDPQVGFDAD